MRKLNTPLTVCEHCNPNSLEIALRWTISVYSSADEYISHGFFGTSNLFELNHVRMGSVRISSFDYFPRQRKRPFINLSCWRRYWDAVVILINEPKFNAIKICVSILCIYKIVVTLYSFVAVIIYSPLFRLVIGPWSRAHSNSLGCPAKNQTQQDLPIRQIDSS